MTRKIPRNTLNTIMTARYSRPSCNVDKSKNAIPHLNPILTESQAYAVI